MKKFFKTLNILGLIGFCCASCSKQNNRVFEDGVYDVNPSYIDQVYNCRDVPNSYYFSSLIKTNITDVKQSKYIYNPDSVLINQNLGGVDDTPFDVVDYFDSFVFCLSENEVVISLRDIVDGLINIYQDEYISVKNLKLYFALDDTLYAEKGKLYNSFIEEKSLSLFLKSYDYFYIFTNEINSFAKNDLYNSRKITQSGNTINISEGILVTTKSFHVFPFKNGKLKLNDLQEFHMKNYKIGYDYHLIKESQYSNKKFEDYFWNDMDESALLNSFTTLFSRH